MRASWPLRAGTAVIATTEAFAGTPIACRACSSKSMPTGLAYELTKAETWRIVPSDASQSVNEPER